MEESKIGALYIRVSTNMQEELSPDAQRRLLLDYAAQHRILVPEEYVFLEKGISGKKADKRPEFMRMISLAKQKPSPFQVILVWKYSRFARNQEESIVYKSILRRQCSVDVVSISEPTVDGPFGSLIERIIEWMDEYYSIRLAGEVTRGMREKALRGGYQARPPLGYRIEKKGEPPVIVPEEADLVRLIFDKYVNGGYSFFTLARWLNEQGYKTSHGKNFETRSLQYILQNPSYYGMVRWYRTHNETNEVRDPSEWIVTQGQHEPIISQELFEAAQERIRLTSKPRGARPSIGYRHWLSGLIKCPECGRSMAFRAAPNRRYDTSYCYFRCYGYNKGKCTNGSTATAHLVEKAVLASLEYVLSNGSVSFSVRPSAVAVDGMELLLRQRERNYAKEARIKAAYQDGIDTLEEYKANKQMLLQERAELDQKIEAMKIAPAQDLTALMVQRIRHAYDVIRSDAFDNQQKSDALQGVVEKIIWHKPEGVADVFYYYK